MTAFTIIARELRTAARQRRTYIVRLLVAVAGIVWGIGLVLFSGGGGRTGGGWFHLFFAVAFLYTLVEGVRKSADAISEEKREGTLGLLFLTDLRSWHILLGKLTPHFLRSFYGLLAFYPVLAIGLLLGGVTPGEFWRATLFLPNCLVYSLCLGLCVSTLSRVSTRAMLGAGFLLAAGLLLPMIARKASVFYPALGAIAFFSPIFASSYVWDSAYQALPGDFWLGNAGILATSLFAFFAGALILSRSWQSAEYKPSMQPERAVANPVLQSKRKEWRQRWLDKNPIAWLAARDDSNRFALKNVFIGVLICYHLLCLSLLFVARPVAAGFVYGGVMLSSLALNVWIAYKASFTFAEARRTGAIELILAAPLTTRDLLTGQLLALKDKFLWPAILAAALPVALMIDDMTQGSNRIGLPFIVPNLGLSYASLSLLSGLLATAWMGMWMGLSSPKPMTAFFKTLGWTVVLRIFLFCIPNPILDLALFFYANDNLKRHFRSLAATGARAA